MRKIIFALMLAVVPVAAMADRQTMNTSDKVSVWMGKANANDEELYTGKANASCFASEDARSACFPGIPRTQWVFSDSAPADLTKLWFDTDQVPGSVVLKVHNGTTWIQQAVGDGGSYTLPTASAETKGGIKVGARLSIDGDGVLSADVQSGTGAVDSVNGNTGTVVLDADDIGDTSTTKKFTTTAEKTTWNAKQNALTAGTDYLTPTGSAAGLTNWPTLNQNTTGSAARLGTARTIAGSSFDGTANIDISYANLIGTPTTTPLTAAIVYGLWTGTGYMRTDGTADSGGGGGSTSLLDMTDWPSGLTLAELGYVGDVTGPIQAQIDSLSAGGIPHVSSGYPSADGAWDYRTDTNLLCTRTSNGDVYCASGFSLASAADVTPEGFAFTDVTNAELSTQYTACDQVTGIDWPATVTASGGTAAVCTSATYATDCGTFGTAPGTVANDGWVCARHTSSASNSTATNTSVTVGTASDTFTTTTATGGVCDSSSDGVLDGVNSGTTEQNSVGTSIFMAQAVLLNSGEIVTGYQLMAQATSYGTGSLFVSLWTDISGHPGSEISGTRVTIAYASLNDAARELEELLLASTYNVTTTGTYHVVIGGVGGDAAYGIYRGTTALGASNYTTDGGTSWYELAGEDYRVEVLGCD